MENLANKHNSFKMLQYLLMLQTKMQVSLLMIHQQMRYSLYLEEQSHGASLIGWKILILSKQNIHTVITVVKFIEDSMKVI